MSDFIDFPVWVLAKADSRVATTLRIKLPNGELAIPTFTDEKLAAEFSGDERFAGFVPKMIEKPTTFSGILEFLEKKVGATHVYVNPSQSGGLLITIAQFRFNVAMQIEEDLL
jgi:hypothetical protein